MLPLREGGRGDLASLVMMQFVALRQAHDDKFPCRFATGKPVVSLSPGRQPASVSYR